MNRIYDISCFSYGVLLKARSIMVCVFPFSSLFIIAAGSQTGWEKKKIKELMRKEFDGLFIWQVWLTYYDWMEDFNFLWKNFQMNVVVFGQFFGSNYSSGGFSFIEGIKEIIETQEIYFWGLLEFLIIMPVLAIKNSLGFF